MNSNNYFDLTYEQAIAELEGIIRKLENGQVGLEESLELYKNGTLLAKICGDMLAKAENQITMLNQTGEGKMTENDFTAESEDGQEIP